MDSLLLFIYTLNQFVSGEQSVYCRR